VLIYSWVCVFRGAEDLKAVSECYQEARDHAFCLGLTVLPSLTAQQPRQVNLKSFRFKFPIVSTSMNFP
jgi:hypothetical protein